MKNVNGTNFSSKDEDLIILTMAKTLSLDTKYVTFVAWGFEKSDRRKLNSAGATVTATSLVTVPTLLFPDFDSSNSLYSFLANKLKTAVTSGEFTSSLNSFAIQLGLSAFESCTADSVTIEQPSISQPAAATVSELSNDDVLGIAFGGAIAFVLVLIMLYFNYGISQKSARHMSSKLQNKMFSPPAGQKVYPFEGGLVDVEVGKVSKELLSFSSDEPCKLIIVDDKMTLRDIDLDTEDKLEVRLQSFVIFDKAVKPQSRFVRAPPPLPPLPSIEVLYDLEVEDEMKDALSVNTEGLDSNLLEDREILVDGDNTVGDDLLTVDGSVTTEILQITNDGNGSGDNDVDEDRNTFDSSLLSHEEMVPLRGAEDSDDAFSVISEIQLQNDAIDRNVEFFASTKESDLLDGEDTDKGMDDQVEDDANSLLSIPTMEDSCVSDESSVVAAPSVEVDRDDKETTAIDDSAEAPEETTVLFVLDSASIDDDLLDDQRKSDSKVLLPEDLSESVELSQSFDDVIVMPQEPVEIAVVLDEPIVCTDDPMVVVIEQSDVAEELPVVIEEPEESTEDFVIPFEIDEITEVVAEESEEVVDFEKVDAEVEETPVEVVIEPPYERPPTPIQSSYVNEITIHDLFDANERFQEFTLDFASAKEGMISKSKVNSLGSFKSGLHKKNSQKSRPCTVDNSSSLNSRPAQSKLEDLEFGDDTIISFGYSLQDMEAPAVLDEKQEPKKAPEIPKKPVLFRSRTVMQLQDNGLPSDNFFSNRTVEIPAIPVSESLPSPPSNVGLTIETHPQPFNDLSEPPKSPLEDDDANRQPSWSMAADTGDLYVPGQANNKSSVTKAQQIQMEKERKQAMEEEAKIAREKEKRRLIEFQAAKDAMVSQSKVQSVGFNSLKAGLTRKDVRTNKGSTVMSSNAEDSDSSLSITRVPSNRASESPITAASAWSTLSRPFTTATAFNSTGNSPAVFQSRASNDLNSMAGAADDDDDSTVDTKSSSLALLLSSAGIELKLKPRTSKSRGGRRKPKTITSSAIMDDPTRDTTSAGELNFESHTLDDTHAFEVGSGDELKEEIDSKAFPVAWGSGKLVNNKKPSYEFSASAGFGGLDSSFASLLFGSRPNSGVKVFPGSNFNDTNDDDELLRPTSAFTADGIDPFAMTFDSTGNTAANVTGMAPTYSPGTGMEWDTGVDDVLPWRSMIAFDSGQADKSPITDMNNQIPFPQDAESARYDLKWTTQEDFPLAVRKKPHRSKKSKRSKLIIEMDDL